MAKGHVFGQMFYQWSTATAPCSLCMHTCGSQRTTCESHFFHHVDPRDWAQVNRFRSKHLNHLQAFYFHGLGHLLLFCWGTRFLYVDLTHLEHYTNTSLNLLPSFCPCPESCNYTTHSCFCLERTLSQVVQVGLKFSKQQMLVLHFFHTKVHSPHSDILIVNRVTHIFNISTGEAKANLLYIVSSRQAIKS